MQPQRYKFCSRRPNLSQKLAVGLAFEALAKAGGMPETVTALSAVARLTHMPFRAPIPKAIGTSHRLPRA